MKLIPGLNLHYYGSNDPNNPTPGQRTLARKTDEPTMQLPPPVPPPQPLPTFTPPPLGIPVEYMSNAPPHPGAPVAADPAPTTQQSYSSTQFASYGTARSNRLRLERKMQKPNIDPDHPNIRYGAAMLQFLGKRGSADALATGLAQTFERRYGSQKTNSDWQDDNEITLKRVVGLCWESHFRSTNTVVSKREFTIRKNAPLIESLSLEDLNTVRGKMLMAVIDSKDNVFICGFQKAANGICGMTANEMWLDDDGKIKHEDPDDIGRNDQRIIAGQLLGTLFLDEDTYTSETPGKLLLTGWAANRDKSDTGDLTLKLISIEPPAAPAKKDTIDSIGKRSSVNSSKSSVEFSPLVRGIGYFPAESIDEMLEEGIVVPISRTLDSNEHKEPPVAGRPHSRGLTQEVMRLLEETYAQEETADQDNQVGLQTEDNPAATETPTAPGLGENSAASTSTIALPSASTTDTLFENLDDFMDGFLSKK